MKYLLALLWVLFASVAKASMVFLAVAVAPQDAYDASADEKLLMAAFRAKDGSSLYLDKSWHGLHFLLTGKAYDATSPVGQAIMGGSALGEDHGYGPMRVLDPRQVKIIATALAKVTPQELSSRYDPETLERAQIYPAIWRRDGPEGLRFLLSYLKPLQAFYEQASANGQAVVLLIA